MVIEPFDFSAIACYVNHRPSVRWGGRFAVFQREMLFEGLREEEILNYL